MSCKEPTGHTPDVAPLEVLIVDDHALLRDSLVRLLASAPLPWRAVRSAASLAEARASIGQHRPDIVLLDVDLGGDDGLQLLRELPAGTRVLVLTSQSDPATRARATRLGACGLVDKGDPAGSLLARVLALGSPNLRGDAAPMQAGT